MDKQIEKRWGIVALGALMFLASLLFGSKGSLYTLVWLMVSYYGYKGDLITIKQWMKWLILINLIALVIVVIFVSDDAASLIPNVSGKIGLALGILIMLIPKIFLYFYVVSKIDKTNLVSSIPSQSFILDYLRKLSVSSKMILIFLTILILSIAFTISNISNEDATQNTLTSNALNNWFKKSNVKNSEWIFIETNEQQGAKIQYFFDVNSIEKKSSSNYVLNIAYVFDDLVYVSGFDDDTIGNVRYAKSLVEINCNERKVKRIKSDIFGSKLTDANQVRLNSRSKEADKEFESRDYVNKLCSVLQR